MEGDSMRCMYHGIKFHSSCWGIIAVYLIVALVFTLIGPVR